MTRMEDRRPRAVQALALGLLMVPLAVVAGAKDEVRAASARFMAAKSWQATMQGSGPQAMSATMEFQAPDRYRMRMPQGEQVLVGDALWMSMGGRTMKIPLPAGTLTQWRQPSAWSRSVDRMVVTAEGSGVVDGVKARRYRLEQRDPMPSTMTLWVGPDGYPLQVVSTGSGGRGGAVTMTIRYSRFNDPAIRVNAPR